MTIIKTPPLQGTPPPIRSAILHDFTGGLNFRDNPLQEHANEVSDISNMDLLAQGGVKRRLSFRPLGTNGVSTANVPRFLFHIPDDVSDGYILVGGQSVTGPTDKLSYWTTIAESQAVVATRSFTTASTNTLNWSGGMMKRKNTATDQFLYIHRDYTHAVQSFQLSDNQLHSELTDAYGNYNENFSSPTGGTMPYASVMCEHRDMMFHGDCYENLTRHGSRLRWSHPGEPGDYRANDFIDIGEGQDNDKIVQILSNGFSLFIFKEKSVWVLDGYSASNFAVTRIARGVGVGNKHAATVGPNGIAFFDRNLGVHMVQSVRVGGQRMWVAEPVWQKLYPAISNGIMTNTRQACMTWVGRKLVASGMIMNAAAEPNVTFVQDLDAGAGWTQYAVGFRIIKEFTPLAAPPKLIGVAPWDGSNSGATNYDRVVIQNLNGTAVDRLDGTNDISFSSYVRTSWVTGGDPSLKKRFRRFSTVFSNLASGHGITATSYRNWQFTADRTYTIDGTYTSGPVEQINVRSGTLGSMYATCLKLAGPTDRDYTINMVTFRFIPQRIV